MEHNSLEAKYHKLASEYSKLRAQASVLKKAVLEEQGQNSTLRDQLRQRETSLRRSEQEVDSLGFRNKQLEHRVGSLQEELIIQENKKFEKEQKKSKYKSNDSTSNNSYHHVSGYENAQDALVFEELQKKIMENAQLTSTLDDKEHELKMHIERIVNLEKSLEKRVSEFSEMEKKLRREIDSLQTRNSELETKLVEAASIIGSEDALSASGSDNTPLHTATNSSGTTIEERIAFLEKEVSHWRTQCEIAKITESFPNEIARKEKNHQPEDDTYCNCSSAATGITVIASTIQNNRRSNNQIKQQQEQTTLNTTKEQFIFNNFSRKFEDLLRRKCESESRVSSYEVECEHLQNCLEDTSRELKSKEEKLQMANRTIQAIEEDLTTTRINYEEQISVLTEQVISLSEQLASCK